ncbi:hypothetical protein KKF47_03495 [Patescibacteria group bacterium]|nr:hypothetical protein [Patescibacteria group bacterium]MBU4467093.1 hypothetical protein [Patescibacteria group bacterium]
MLPPGHIAASYILIKSVETLGFKISLPEIMLILVASVVLDFDLIVAHRLKKSHHDLFTHTPWGVFLIWLGFILLFGANLSLATKILVLVVFFIHLFLDELGFWLCKLGFQEVSKESQINWLYPIKKFKDRQESFPLNAKFLLHYYQKAKANVFLEIVLSLIALLVFWLT